MNNPVSKDEKTKSPIIFYCKDCGQVVDTERVGKKYVYKCKMCGTKNVAFGTDKSIKSFFRIPEEKGAPVEEAKVEAKKTDKDVNVAKAEVAKVENE